MEVLFAFNRFKVGQKKAQSQQKVSLLSQFCLGPQSLEALHTQSGGKTSES